MRPTLLAAAVVVLTGLALCATGCASSQEGVKTNYMTQWTKVAANTQTTTDAAKAVLDDQGLKEVNASSTAVDGTANGKMADGTKVKVAIKKATDTSSDVSVTVGTMGDPTLGAEIARKIKSKAEGK